MTWNLQYTNGLRAKEQEEKEARLAKLRPAIRNMLKGNPNVFHYTTFRTADKLFAQHPIWQQARIEAERKLIFEEYIAELKQREMVRCFTVFIVSALLSSIFFAMDIARVPRSTDAQRIQGCRIVQGLKCRCPYTLENRIWNDCGI